MSFHATAGLLAALLVPTARATTQDPPPPVYVTDEGLDVEVRGLIDALVSEVEKDPSNVEAHIDLGLAYEANTLFVPAAACYRNVLKLAPDQNQWLYRLGVMQHANGDVEGALASMRVAAEAFKNTPVIQARLGDLLLAVGEPDEAAAAWERAIAAEASQPRQIQWAPSRVGLARARYDQGRVEEAAKLLEEALALDIGYRHAHYLLGLCYLDLGREEEGELQLKLGVNAWPQFPPDPHQPRLDAYSVGFSRRMMGIENKMQAGAIVEAEAALREILAERPGDFLVLNLLARSLAAQGRADEALETLRKSEIANPQSYATKIELSVALLNRLGPLQAELAPLQAELQGAAQGQPITVARRTEVQEQVTRLAGQLEALAEECVTKAREGAQLAPNLGRARYFHGLAVFMTAGGDPQRSKTALGEFEAALTLGCQEADLFRYAGMAYAQTGRLRDMVEFAETLADKQPTNPSAFTFLAQAYMTKDQWEPERELRGKAVAAIARARQIAPNDPALQEFEAVFAAEAKRRNDAEDAAAKDGPQSGPPLPPDDDGGDDK